jgi:hypothetical protein
LGPWNYSFGVVNRDFETGEVLWEYDVIPTIPADAKEKKWGAIDVTRKFIIHKDLLIFRTYYWLIALNIHTGEQVYTVYQGAINSQVYDNGILYTNKEKSSENIFSKIDLDTGVVLITKTIDKTLFSTPNEMQLYTYINVSDQHVIFTYRCGIHFVFLNKETLELEHVFTIKQTAKERKASVPVKESFPIMHEGKLYQLLGNGELLVFDMVGLV